MKYFYVRHLKERNTYACKYHVEMAEFKLSLIICIVVSQREYMELNAFVLVIFATSTLFQENA
jgi:hypothetical protein